MQCSMSAMTFHQTLTPADLAQVIFMFYDIGKTKIWITFAAHEVPNFFASNHDAVAVDCRA